MELTVVNSKRKILWEPEEEIQPAPKPQPKAEVVVEQKPNVVHELVLPEGSKIIVQPHRAYKKRQGNGHKSVKVRDLWDAERDAMRHQLFLPQNGQISDDDCLAFKPKVGAEVGVFQITGFVSVLHRYVAEGRLQVNNLAAYENWMSQKYGGSLWAQYNNPKFVAVRQQNQAAIAAGQKPLFKVGKDQTKQISISLTPKFVAFPKKKWSGS